MDSGMTTTQELAFGELLRRYRHSGGFTQEELAERATLSARAISDLERGLKYRPRKDTVRLLADALELTGNDRGAFERAARGIGKPDRISPQTSPETPG
jgi:transcriptional regulator with XRE-family HTH domain